MAEKIEVEVVFALPEKQRLVTVEVAEGSTIADVIAASGLQSRFRDADLEACTTGLWGKVVPRETVISNGDRVEIYRPLAMDPREARRQLAEAGRTMGQTDGD